MNGRLSVSHHKHACSLTHKLMLMCPFRKKKVYIHSLTTVNNGVCPSHHGGWGVAQHRLILYFLLDVPIQLVKFTLSLSIPCTAVHVPARSLPPPPRATYIYTSGRVFYWSTNMCEQLVNTRGGTVVLTTHERAMYCHPGGSLLLFVIKPW